MKHGSTVVMTRSACARCTSTTEVVGAEGDVPPEDWALVTATVRRPGSGWTNSRRDEYILCPECAFDVGVFLARVSGAS